MLQKELGKGGEGGVYEVAGQPCLAAKIYFNQPDAQQIQQDSSNGRCSK